MSPFQNFGEFGDFFQDGARIQETRLALCDFRGPVHLHGKGVDPANAFGKVCCQDQPHSSPHAVAEYVDPVEAFPVKIFNDVFRKTPQPEWPVFREGRSVAFEIQRVDLKMLPQRGKQR